MSCAGAINSQTRRVVHKARRGEGAHDVGVCGSNVYVSYLESNKIAGKTRRDWSDRFAIAERVLANPGSGCCCVHKPCEETIHGESYNVCT